MVNQYKIEDISYVQVRKKEQTSLVCSRGPEHYFDLFNSSYFSKYRDRIYKKSDVIYINSFINMLNNYELYVLLINSSGKVDEMVTEYKAMHILDVYKKIKDLSEEQLTKIDKISDDVTNICINKLAILDQSFYELLNKFIKTDLISNGLGVHSAIISKNNNMVDYKIIRTLKYLGIDINLNKVPNFKINYNYREINIYDQDNNLIETISFDSKVKKLVDKKQK